LKRIVLLDFSAIAHSDWHGAVKNEKTIAHDDKMDYHAYIVMTHIKQYIAKFLPIDEFVVCCDDGSWRYDFYEYYKYKRNQKKKEDPLTYELMKESMDNILTALDKYFPYNVVKVKKAEGDDVIGALVEELHNEFDDIVIISRDKDFQQLQKYKNVRQYNYMKDEFIVCDDPYAYLNEMYLIGDSDDGVPNMHSPDNIFLLPDRQKQMNKKVKSEYHEGIKEYVKKHDLKKNFIRNRKLVELSSKTIPKKLFDNIMYMYYDNKNNGRTKINYMGVFKYLSAHVPAYETDSKGFEI